MQSPKAGHLQVSLQLFADRTGIFANEGAARTKLSADLKRERDRKRYGSTTRELVSIFQEERQLECRGELDEPTANTLNRLLDELSGPEREEPEFVAHARLCFSDRSAAAGTKVSAFDGDLRREQQLGQSRTDKQSFNETHYSSRQFLEAEEGTADLIVKALATKTEKLGSP